MNNGFESSPANESATQTTDHQKRMLENFMKSAESRLKHASPKKRKEPFQPDNPVILSKDENPAEVALNMLGGDSLLNSVKSIQTNHSLKTESGNVHHDQSIINRGLSFRGPLAQPSMYKIDEWKNYRN